jgi:UDP-glucose 6-dehydrogenase
MKALTQTLIPNKTKSLSRSKSKFRKKTKIKSKTMTKTKTKTSIRKETKSLSKLSSKSKKELVKRGVKVKVYNPKAMQEAKEQCLKGIENIEYCNAKYEVLKKADAVILF